MSKKLFSWLAISIGVWIVWQLPNPWWYWDEWTYLRQLSEIPLFQWIFMPHLEHVVPLSKLLYGGSVSLFGITQTPLLILLYTLHALNIMLSYRLLFQMSNSRNISILLTAVFGLHVLHAPNLMWPLQTQLLLCHSLFLISFLSLHKRPWISSVLSIIAPFTFGFGMLLAPLCLVYSWLTSPKANQQQLLTFTSITLLNGLIYLFAIRQNLFISTDGFSVSDVPAVLEYWLFAIRHNLSNVLLLGVIKNHFILSLLSITVAVLAYSWSKQLRPFIIFALLYYGFSFLPFAFTRLEFGPWQSTSGRYVYLYLLPALILSLPLLQRLTKAHRSLQASAAAIMIVLFGFSINELHAQKTHRQWQFDHSRQELQAFAKNPQHDPDLSQIFPEEEVSDDFALSILQQSKPAN